MAFGTDPTPDGLANPPIDDLMKHADSKYALAIFAAKRARQLLDGAELKETKARSTKNVTNALEEIAEGKISYELDIDQ